MLNNSSIFNTIASTRSSYKRKYEVPKLLSFDTIQSYIDTPANCFVCGSPLTTLLHGSQYSPIIKVENITSNKVLKRVIVNSLANIVFYEREKSVVTHFSTQTGNRIDFFTSFSDKNRLDFSVDCLTNKVDGIAAEVQDLIWNLNLKFSRACLSYKDNHFYLTETNPLFLERKSNSIYRMSMKREKFSYIDGDNLLEIESNYNNSLSTIMIRNKVVNQIPLVTLFNSANQDRLVNKIKTIALFY